MYDTFYLPRFGRLLRKTLLERPMQLFGFTAAILLLLFIYYTIFHGQPGKWIEIQKDTVFFGLTGGGTILAAFIFGYFGSNAQGSSFLTLPASHLEKWLCAILITGVFYPLIFWLFFRLMDASFVGWYHSHLDPARPDFQQRYDAAKIFPLDHVASRNALIYFLNYAGAMLVGSLYFNKASLIKVGLVIGGVFLAIYAVNFLIATLVIGHILNAYPFDSVDILLSSSRRSIPLSSSGQKYFDIGLTYILPTALWTIAYFRLRDKEF